MQSGRDEGPGRSRRSRPATRRRIGAAGRRSSSEVRRTHARHVGRLRRVLPRARRARACPTASSGPSSSPSRRGSTCTRIRPRPTTSATRPLGPTWHRLDSTVRAADTTWELPEHLAERDGALIYLSLGSLGSADVGLMQRLVDLLATTEHRVIVSKGPLADQITLHDNQTGEGVPAAAGDPAAGRPRHHPRRQQHRHRGVPPRQADDRAAAVLGPGRQRPAGRRDRASAGGCRPTASATRS